MENSLRSGSLVILLAFLVSVEDLRRPMLLDKRMYVGNGDCWDEGYGLHPRATEVNGNGFDDNCNGSDGVGHFGPYYRDFDYDGYRTDMVIVSPHQVMITRDLPAASYTDPSPDDRPRFAPGSIVRLLTQPMDENGVKPVVANARFANLELPVPATSSDVEDRLITLPNADEMLKRLIAINSHERLVRDFYPLLLEDAGMEKVAIGVFLMITQAIDEYAEGQHPAVGTILSAGAHRFVPVLVDDPEVAEAIQQHFASYRNM